VANRMYTFSEGTVKAVTINVGDRGPGSVSPASRSFSGERKIRTVTNVLLLKQFNGKF